MEVTTAFFGFQFLVLNWLVLACPLFLFALITNPFWTYDQLPGIPKIVFALCPFLMFYYWGMYFSEAISLIILIITSNFGAYLIRRLADYGGTSTEKGKIKTWEQISLERTMQVLLVIGILFTCMFIQYNRYTVEDAIVSPDVITVSRFFEERTHQDQFSVFVSGIVSAYEIGSYVEDVPFFPISHIMFLSYFGNMTN